MIQVNGSVLRGGSEIERYVLGERLVVSRALSHFEVMSRPVGTLGPRLFRAAMLAARSRSPLANPEFYLEWRDADIGVWSWPSGIEREIDRFEGEIIPETLLHEPTDGARLAQTIDGFEGQIWSDRKLIASRWWREPPRDEQWSSFLRAARSEPNGETTSPVPVKPDWSSGPNRLSQACRAFSRRRATNRDVASLLLVLVCAPVLYWGTQAGILSIRQGLLEHRLGTLSGATQEVGEARVRAEESLVNMQAYISSLETVHPVRAISAFVETIQDEDIELMELDFRESEFSVIFGTANSPDFAPAPIVAALEGRAEFADILIEPRARRGEWQITGQVR